VFSFFHFPSFRRQVVGLSLAASRLCGDLADLVPLFAMLPQLRMLLLQSNPGVTGELSHLMCAFLHLFCLFWKVCFF
jgi:hypothetical protein